MFLNHPFTRKIFKHGIAVLSFILLWLSFFTFPGPQQTLSIDASWHLVLAEAFKQHWQAGVDYIFTYGPLGYFCLKDPNYDANLFYATVSWWIVANFLLAVVFVTRGYYLHNWLEKVFYFSLLIVVIPELSYFTDAWYLLGMLGITLLLIQPPPFLTTTTTRYGVVVGMTLLGFTLLSLTKFNLLLLAVACVSGMSLVFWQRHSFQIAILFLTAFVMIWIGGWLLLSQSLGNIPTFLSNSWQVSTSYATAMSLKPSQEAVWWALATISLTTLLISINTLTKPPHLAQFIASGIILLTLFLGWKSSFVRYDNFHFSTFFSIAMIVPFWLPRILHLGTLRSVLFNSLLVLNVLVAMLGTFYLAEPYGYTVSNFSSRWYNRITNHITTLWSLGNYKHTTDQTTAKIRTWYDLPKIRATVGYATVDMFSPAQSILIHNVLNYHPRPVFQGYVAYTESLLEANGQFYANPQTAPNFIIFTLDIIDNRFPTMEDANALNIILRDYQPRFVEKGWLLLEHKPRISETTVTPPLLTKIVKFGEKVELRQFNSSRLFLSVDIQDSLLGKLNTLFFQTPAIMLELETTDGIFLTYRLIPSLSHSAFLLNPLLLNQTDWLTWYLGHPLKQVAALRVIVESEEIRPFFQPTVTVKLTEAGISPYPLTEDTKHRLQEDLLLFAVNSIPDSISAPSNVVTENGRTVLVTDSPSEIHFKRPKGHYQFKGGFGILASTYNNLVNYQPATIGVEFSWLVVDSHGQEHLLSQKLLQPLKVLDDKKIQPFENTIDFPEENQELILRTRALPPNNPLGKAAFWTNIQLERKN